MAIINLIPKMQSKQPVLPTLPLLIVACLLLTLCASTLASPFPAAAGGHDLTFAKRQDSSYAQPGSPQYLNDEYYIYTGTVTTTAGIVGTIFIIIGIYLGALGYRGFRITLGVIGLLLFATISFIALVNAEPYWGYTAPNHIIFTAIPFGLGLLGAIAFMLFWPVSLYFIGGMGGFFLILYIMAFKEDHVIVQTVARYCVLVGFFLLGCLATFVAERIVIIFSTSFMGAYLFMFGLDIFIHVGLVNSVRSLLDGNYQNYDYTLNWHVYVELAFIPIIMILFFVWQYLTTFGRKFGMAYAKEAAPPPPHH